MTTTIEFPKVFFVSGTDTDVGKTVVSTVLALGLNAYYWKPVQSGPETDSSTLEKMGVDPARILPETFTLSEPLSPHLAARLDNKYISLDDLTLPIIRPDQYLIVEGAGGLLVPLNEDKLVIDLIQKLELPVVLVSRTTLGTINHTLLSIEALKARNIPIVGVIMSGEPNEENKKAIEQHSKIKVIGVVPKLESLNKKSLLETFERVFGQREVVHEK